MFVVLVFSLTIHEMAHAWTADRLGDPTARLLGRVSLNPLVHADLIGTVVFPLVALVSGVPLIGWAKPVPVNIRRLRHERRDYVLVAAAGPASNLVLAFAAATVTSLRWRGTRWATRSVRSVLPLPAGWRRADQPSPGGLQHDSHPAARWRQRAERAAAERPCGALRSDPALRLPAPVRVGADRRLSVSGRPAVQLSSFLASVTDVRARVVSGMRPTGRLHLGHLVGALGNWVPLQEQYDCYYFVADWHALTSDFADTSQLTSYAYENVADWIGAGLDPEKSTFFIQSLVPEHAELYLLLSMVVPVPVARAGADLQGAAGESQGQGPVIRWLPELPAAADRRRRHVRRAVRAGRRRSGRASGTGPGGRAALQQRLRPGSRRCSSSRNRC